MRVFICLLLATACSEPPSDESPEEPPAVATPAAEIAPRTPEPAVVSPSEPAVAPVEPAIVPVVPVEATGEPAPRRDRVRTSTRSQDNANLRRLHESGGADALREARRDPSRAPELLRNAQRSGQVRR